MDFTDVGVLHLRHNLQIKSKVKGQKEKPNFLYFSLCLFPLAFKLSLSYEVVGIAFPYRRNLKIDRWLWECNAPTRFVDCHIICALRFANIGYWAKRGHVVIFLS